MEGAAMTNTPVADWIPALAGFPGPRYRAIAAALQEAIGTGRLPPGSRLPTHRDLAWRLGVTVGTVTRAYQEVERQGLIGGETGRGTFVRDPAGRDAMPLEPVPSGTLIDLSVNASAIRPDAPLLRAAMEAAAARHDLSALMGYNAAHGADRLRRAGADWITRLTGLPVAADQVLVTGGGQGAMHAALAAVTRPGGVLLVEQLTYPGIRTLAGHLGLRLVPVPLDRQGLLPDAVEALAEQHGASVLYCMPTQHNPTTATLPVARRQALVAVARRRGLTLVEDDVYGFLAPDPPPPLAAIGPDVTIYLTGLSKSLFPGLRTGFALAPPPLVERLAGVVRATLMSPTHLGAVVAAELIQGGPAEEIMQRRRAQARERQAMARRILGVDPPGSDPAATHLWLPLPEPWRREEFARILLERGIKVTPADAFAVARGDIPHALRICLCLLERPDILEQALETIAGLLREMPEGGGDILV